MLQEVADRVQWALFLTEAQALAEQWGHWPDREAQGVKPLARSRLDVGPAQPHKMAQRQADDWQCVRLVAAPLKVRRMLPA